MEVPEAKRLIHAMKLDCMKPVVALTFLSALQCLCVIHDDSSMVDLFTLEGIVIGCFDSHLRRPTGAAALKTINAVVFWAVT